MEEVTQILGFDAVNKWAKMPGAKISQAITAANDAKTAADNAMPKSGGTFSGDVYLNGNASTDTGNKAATCAFVLSKTQGSMKDTASLSLDRDPIFEWTANNQIFFETQSKGCILKMKSPMILTSYGQAASCRVIFMPDETSYSIGINASNTLLPESDGIGFSFTGLERGNVYIADIIIARLRIPGDNEDVLQYLATCNPVVG